MTSADISPSTYGGDVKATGTAMLRMSNVDTFYCHSQVLHDVTLEVYMVVIVCLLGDYCVVNITTI